MQAPNHDVDTDCFAKCIEVSKRVGWQYIFYRVEHLRFQKLTKELTIQDQYERLNEALKSIKTKL